MKGSPGKSVPADRKNMPMYSKQPVTDDRSLSEGERIAPYSLAVEAFGSGGTVPGSLGAALYGVRCFPSYQRAVRANITAGGDSVR
jgi:ADP-ribosylglycohydrolase